MASTGWTSLEIVKLVVAGFVPIAVIVLGLPIARAARRLEHAQWASRKLIELRLELYATMAPLLNDLLCFFRTVGDFQQITPPEAVAHKRALDKAFHVNKYLMGDTFAERFHEFMEACFVTYTGRGQPAKLRASRTKQQAERAHWDDAWDDFLIPEGATPSGLAEIERRYEALMTAFSEELEIQPERRRRRLAFSRR
jgi:hypothetical protein